MWEVYHESATFSLIWASRDYLDSGKSFQQLLEDEIS